MDAQEMLKMFGLEEKPSAAPAKPVQTGHWEGRNENPQNIAKEIHPVCLELDEWDMAQGVKLQAARHTDKPEDSFAMADFHGLAYLVEPSLLPPGKTCQDTRRWEFVTALLESPEYKALHKGTMLNKLASEIAANQFFDSFVQLEKRDKERKRCQGGKPKAQAREPIQAEMACLTAAAEAAEHAKEEVEDLESTCQAVGLGQGESGKALNLEHISSTYKRVKRNNLLKRICELAGRYRRLAQAKQRQKQIHGFDDMVGIELSGDVGRLLPTELAMLTDPDFELDAMRRLVERQSMSRHYKGIEPVGKGPIIVCVDESGSMEGEPVCNAKAFALAMAWIAKHQRRWCALVGYSGGCEGTRIALPPNKWDDGKLLDWLSHFYGRGTTMDVPLAELPGKYWDELKCPRGKTDLIIITDGIVHIPDEMQKTFKDWKVREKVRCISLILGGYDPGELASVSDEVFQIDGIDISNSAVGRCLSI